MASDHALANRVGFFTLGLTNNFAYVIMLTAAFDLLKASPNTTSAKTGEFSNNSTSYCNPLSTSTILLADIVPSFLVKLSYPFLLLTIPTVYKVTVVALLSGISFLVTGFANSHPLVFFGVICASLSSGLGESTFLTSIPSYGDASLSGWSMGTGAAGVLGAFGYASLRKFLSIEFIMMIMLVIPVSMMGAYLFVIRLVDATSETTTATSRADFKDSIALSKADEENSHINRQSGQEGEYGATDGSSRSIDRDNEFGYHEKLHHLPKLAKYFLPLFLVYFAEYFINQGLFELIYFPEVAKLDHASQYSWFQVSYQVGVLISRSSLDLFRIKQLWLMSILQVLNAILFLAHVAKIIHIPAFHIVILLIIYEGLLGGFTYANTFYRIKREVAPERREFSMGVSSVADTLGIVGAALVALPVHDALCKLY